jgi:NADPH-dependent curcumin reductase
VTASTNRRWLVRSKVDGAVSEANFEWATGPIPRPGPGQALVRNLWFSFDPTMVLAMGTGEGGEGVPVGSPMQSLTVCEVVESNHPKFRPGDLIHTGSYWEDYSVVDGSGFIPGYRLPPGVTPNLGAGTLGVTGMVAYFGMVEVGRPRTGETVVVSAAAGGVGTVALQVAKILGARTIGITGGADKSGWLARELHPDAVIDHRSEQVGPRLRELCPDGIDVYFDNVGGPMLDLALDALRDRGRVVLCGITSWYLEKDTPPGPVRYPALIMKNARMEGLLGRDYVARYPEAARVMLGWIREGRLRSMEDVAEGLENAPRAIAAVFAGANHGKQLLHLADPTPAALRRALDEAGTGPGTPDPPPGENG